MLKIYGFYRSSAAYRVRIALELKALDWESIPVNLRLDEQNKTHSYKTIRKVWFRFWNRTESILRNRWRLLNILMNFIRKILCSLPEFMSVQKCGEWRIKSLWKCTP